jgi:large subunit ribosomal protein L30
MSRIGKLKVRQVSSSIGRPEPQRKVLAGLGLGRIGKSVVVENTPSFRGKIKKVLHLVDVHDMAS